MTYDEDDTQDYVTGYSVSIKLFEIISVLK